MAPFLHPGIQAIQGPDAYQDANKYLNRARGQLAATPLAKAAKERTRVLILDKSLYTARREGEGGLVDTGNERVVDDRYHSVKSG